MTSLQLGKRCRAAVILTALLLAGACIFSGCASSAQLKPPAPVNLGDNAALKYWIAFALLQNLSPEQQALLDNWNTLPMDKTTIALIDQGKASLDILRQAAQVRPCDWGFKKASPEAFMPQLRWAHQAAHIACLRAKYLIGTSDSAGAVSDLLAVYALARQINSDGPSICFILECTCEDMATDTAAGCLTRLNREQLRRLSAGFDELPPRRGFREAVLDVQAEAKWWTDRLNAMDDEGKKKVLLMWIAPIVLGPENDGAKINVTAEKFREYTRGFDKAPEYFKDLAALGSLPILEFDRQAEVLVKKMKADCPLVATMFFQPLTWTRHIDARSEAKMAMLKAAIAVVLDGPDRIKEFKDPFGDGPFGYTKAAEGFALTSKLPILLEGKPATLTLFVPK